MQRKKNTTDMKACERKENQKERYTTEGESCTSEGSDVAHQGARGRCAANWFPISSKRRHTYGSSQNKDAAGLRSGTRTSALLGNPG